MLGTLRKVWSGINKREERDKLPADLIAWRTPGKATDLSGKLDERLWGQLRRFFKSRGYTFWPVEYAYLQTDPGGELVCNGFGYASLQRGWDSSDGTSSYQKLKEFDYANPLCWAARAADGRDVVIRVLAVGSHGKSHVEILKLLSRRHYSVVDRNHAIPLFELIKYDNITFGIFPKIGFSVFVAYGPMSWAKNSVGDIVDMFMQCVEALEFIHYVGVAHKDAFRDNFLVQFQPESLAMNRIAVTRPRVYLTDFETAVYFPPKVPWEKRVCVGLPSGGSFPAEKYGRVNPPELLSDAPYDPFKLDVWQLAISFVDLTTTVPSIDNVMEAMRCPDASSRPSSHEALSKLVEAVASLPPQSLLIPPVIAAPE
ncbi:hypothetical protein K466DRAFT_597791 [Polyporus arcularius HHB13444]|uniref:Protein kinase domain-containing protein n=1 Tax=Polyporus arcularius HHB13444 TaxID=1314778 RepID=A0A5C3PIP1_9APHY|nr:hypothetical protein K466DRAFT_597791 [Polyporus arcularius HHB13444]